MAYDCEKDTLEHIGKVREMIAQVIMSLAVRAACHDKSKLSDAEKPIFNEFTPKLKSSTYGSDEYKSFLKGMKPALDHHYKNNLHHPEHFEKGIRGMSLIDIVEMFCDWKAATMRHADGDILKSIDINQTRFDYDDDLVEIFRNTVRELLW